MYPLLCHVNLCGTVLDTAALRETHARDVHGFPLCTKCVNKRYTNINLFEQHLNTMHLKERCGYPNCTAEFWAADELHHASTKHGYPGCLVCRKISKTVKMFNKHNLGCADPVIVCGLCSESLPQSEMKEHALTHGYPECPYCKTVVRGGNESNFYAHVKSCRGVTVECSLCLRSLFQFEMKEHALTHGYPSCPNCKTVVEGGNESNFYAHVKSCNQSINDVIVCSLCAGNSAHFGEAPRLPCNKQAITEHLVAVHNFKGFECPHCDMGRTSGGTFINICVFMQHISNCEYGKTHNCADCGNVFESTRLYWLHRNGECVPVGETGLSFMAYAKKLHGSEMDMVCGRSRLRVKWDLSHYVKCLDSLPTPFNRVDFPLLTETKEERIFRQARRGGGDAEGKVDESGAVTGCEGGPFTLTEDPRIFQQVSTSATSHSWLFQLCGTSWELGGGKTPSLLMNQRLCMMDYFTKRSAYDVWIYLVSRFCKYTKTIYELNEVKGLLTSCELPEGVSCQYRDLDFVNMFSGSVIANTRKDTERVIYGTRKGGVRGVIKEVSKLTCKRKRVVFLESNLPVELHEAPLKALIHEKLILRPIINFDDFCVDMVPAPACVEISPTPACMEMSPALKLRKELWEELGIADQLEEYENGGNNPLIVKYLSNAYPESTFVKLLTNLTNVQTDVRMSGDILDCVQLAETGSPTGPASIVNARRAALYALSPHEYAAHSSPACGDNVAWSELCWEMIYMVYRDFMTYFVETQSFERLRLYSNFMNDIPRFGKLEELMFKFRPFIVRDMKLPGMRFRASVLFYGLQAEYCCLRNLYKTYLRKNRLNESDSEKYDLERLAFLSKSVHRSVYRRRRLRTPFD